MSIRLLALLEKMTDEASPDDVHKLRTSVRRVEVRLVHCPPKVAKSLRALRKKAGKVRDIDVHIELLKTSVFTSPAPSVREDLRRILKSKRARHEDSLLNLVANAAPLLESRLPKLVQHAATPTADARAAQQLTAEARRQFIEWTQTIPEAGEPLHRLRIDTKKLRYSLEPLSAFADAADVAARLKQVQDSIGNWHDWATLLELASRELDSTSSETVFAAIEARTTGEFRKARRTAERVRQWMTSAKQAASVPRANTSQGLIRKAG